MTLFILAFLTYLAYAVLTVMTGCWRYARSASGVMQWGLRLISVGWAASLAYVVVKLMAILGFAAGIPMSPKAEGVAAQVLVAVGALLVAVGSAATATSQRVSELRNWCREPTAACIRCGQTWWAPYRRWRSIPPPVSGRTLPGFGICTCACTAASLSSVTLGWPCAPSWTTTWRTQ